MLMQETDSTCSSCWLYPSSHRKEKRLCIAALDPGDVFSRFSGNAPITLATPFSLLSWWPHLDLDHMIRPDPCSNLPTGVTAPG